MPRVLLLLPASSYRAEDFLEAAKKLGVEMTVGSEGKNLMSSQNPGGYLTLKFSDLESSATAVAAFSTAHPLQAILGVDESTTVAASYFSERLSLKANPVQVAEACRNKRLMRERLRLAGLPIPDYTACSIREDPRAVGEKVLYPCVLKPILLSASQGVIRADNPQSFVQAWSRLRRIIREQNTSDEILVESFVPGEEVALEGLLENGVLKMLALFDKPDPLEGPFFEETLYIRPSRLPAPVQERIFTCAADAAKALGLKTGPVHAEFRINTAGVWVLEIASRPIGGKCSRALRFGWGVSLEELILGQALGKDASAIRADPIPSGVMMIPIPRPGVLRRVSGVEKARRLPGIEDVLLNIPMGQTLVPLPEGSRYLGFIFAKASTAERVEQALRSAHRCLRFEIEPPHGRKKTPAEERCSET